MTARTVWVDTAGIGEHLHVSRSTVRRYVAAGMPAHRPPTGGHWRFDVDEVDAWMHTQSRDTRQLRVVAGAR